MKIKTGEPCFYKLSNAITHAVASEYNSKAYRMFDEDETVYLYSEIENMYDSIKPPVDWSTVKIPDEVSVVPMEICEIDGLKFVKFDFAISDYKVKNIWGQVK